MEYTNENIEWLANEIVDKSFDVGDLCQYVYEDLVNLMGNNKELFEQNLTDYIDETDNN